MEELCPDRPSFVAHVNLTSDGSLNGDVLRGEWTNFRQVIQKLGSRQFALDGSEHYQLGPGVHLEHELLLVFFETPGQVVDHIRGISDGEFEVGIVRRYSITSGFLDEVWKFKCEEKPKIFGASGRMQLQVRGKFIDLLRLA